MKTLKLLLFYLAVFVAALFFTRCSLTEDIAKITDSLDSLKVSVGTPQFKTGIHFEFVDAKTGEYITEKELKLIVTGNDASKVYDNIGSKAESYNASYGMLDLVIDPEVDSAYLAANPIKINVTPVVNGYLSLSQQVEISRPNIKNVIIALINLTGSNPDGVKVSIQNLSPTYDSQGKTISTIVQQIDGANTTIELLQGTVLKSASGSVLKGNISSQVVYFNPKDSATQNIIQGILTGDVQLDRNNPQSTQGKLVSAGMFAAQLSVGGQIVKTFDGAGLKLKTRVAPDLYNPDKDRVVNVGDTVPMWSQEELTGKWVFEKNSVIKSDVEGMYLEDVVNHLSYWNWDWFTREIGGIYCDYPYPRINWNLTGVGSANVDIIVKLNGVTSQYPTMKEIIYPYAYTEFGFFPRNRSGNIKFVDPKPLPGRKLIFTPASIDFANLNRTVKTVNVTAEYDNNDLYDVNINLSAKSTDPKSKIIIKPNAYLYYKPAAVRNWEGVNLRNGKTTFKLKLGQPYDILAYFGNNSGKGTLLVEKYGANQLQITMTPTMNLNSGTTGSAIKLPPVSKPANNIVNVDYTAILSASVFNTLK